MRVNLHRLGDAGAIAMFGEKYSEAAVRVVEVPGASLELCGGTHVQRTSQVQYCLFSHAICAHA